MKKKKREGTKNKNKQRQRTGKKAISSNISQDIAIARSGVKMSSHMGGYWVLPTFLHLIIRLACHDILAVGRIPQGITTQITCSSIAQARSVRSFRKDSIAVATPSFSSIARRHACALNQ